MPKKSLVELIAKERAYREGIVAKGRLLADAFVELARGRYGQSREAS